MKDTVPSLVPELFHDHKHKPGFTGSSAVKDYSAMQEPQETWVQSLGQERFPEEGNGNPLQYCCLENPTVRGAWLATVRRVAKSQKRLSKQAIIIREH